jgi:hypothetical protein
MGATHLLAVFVAAAPGTVPDALKIDGLRPSVSRLAGEGPTLHLMSLKPPDTSAGSRLAAYCFATLNRGQGETLFANVSADWFAEWYLDGRLVYSTMLAGNEHSPGLAEPPLLISIAHPGNDVVADERVPIRLEIRKVSSDPVNLPWPAWTAQFIAGGSQGQDHTALRLRRTGLSVGRGRHPGCNVDRQAR